MASELWGNVHGPVSLNYERKNQDSMKDLVNLKKDYIYLKKDYIYFKELCKKTRMPAPLLTLSLRMIIIGTFIVCKWCIILPIPIVIGSLIYEGVTNQFSEKESKNFYDPLTDLRAVDVSPEKITFKSVQISDSPIEEDGIFWQITNIIESETIKIGTRIDEYQFQIQSEGKFVKLILIIKNESIKTKTINIQEIQLVDHKNRHFPLTSEAENLFTQPRLIASSPHGYNTVTLKPDIPVKLNLLFEVAEDSENYLLNLYYGF